MSKKSPWAASALALAVSSAFGQSVTESSSNPPYQVAYLDTVVVSATRFEQVLSDVPAYTQVIFREEIEQSGVTSLTEAVQKIGNLNVRSTNGGPLGILSTIDMRGYGASARDNTLILVDGMRVSPIDSASIRWESIPLGSVERIEIIHGGGSVQFGERAVGGIVNIITRGEDRQSHVIATAGSYGATLINGALRTKAGQFKSQLNFSAEGVDGWRDNSQAKQASLRGLFAYEISQNNRIFFDGTFATQDYGTPGAVLGEVNQGNRRAAKFNNVDEKTVTNGSRSVVGLESSIGHGLTFLSELGYSDSGQTQYTPNSTGSVKQSRYDKWSWDLTPRIKKDYGQGTFSVFGLDYQQARASYNTDTGDRQNATQENISTYLTHHQKFGAGLVMNGGFRRQTQNADAYDQSSGAVTTAERRQSANAADLGLSYLYGNSLRNKIFIRGNQSYRFANSDEYWGWGGPPSYAREFKGILKPQVAVTYEVGGAWSIGSESKLNATVFQVNTKDEIRYCVSAACDYGSNVNADKIERKGITIGGKAVVASNLYLSPSLTYQESKYMAGQFSGKEVPIAPKTLASIGVVYNATQHLMYRLFANYVGEQFYEGDETNTLQKIPAYTVIDGGLQYKRNQWVFDFSVKNLTNERYASFGGYGFVTLSPSSSGNSYYYYPGDPRTFWLSARYNFN